MPNHDNPYTIGGFLKNKLEGQSQNQQPNPNRPTPKDPQKASRTDSSPTEEAHSTSEIGLVGETLTETANVLLHAPRIIASRLIGKGIPPDITSKYQQIDQKLYHANPDSLVVKGLKMLWKTPPQPESSQPDSPVGAQPPQENPLTQTERPRLPIKEETPEEQMARLASEQDGQFDATAPVDPRALQRNRSYAYIGYNSLEVSLDTNPTPKPQVNLRPQPVPNQTEQLPTQASRREKPAPQSLTATHLDLLMQHGLNIIPGRGILHQLENNRNNTRTMTPEDIRFIRSIIGSNIDLSSIPQSPAQKPQKERPLTREDLEKLTKYHTFVIPNRGILYTTPEGQQKTRSITSAEKLFIQSILGSHVDLSLIPHQEPSQQITPSQKTEKIQQNKPTQSINSQLNNVTSVRRKP